MSRIGKLPIAIPAGVTVKVADGMILAKGPKGELKQQLHSATKLEISDTEVKVDINNHDDGKERALWGLMRSLVQNMVIGVSVGYEKKMDIKGVGYRAAVSGQKLTLNLGYSNPVEMTMPTGITASVENNTLLTISGIDKQLVGEISAQIRKKRPPEPYKGKGVKYVDEVLRRKAGKTAASAK